MTNVTDGFWSRLADEISVDPVVASEVDRAVIEACKAVPDVTPDSVDSDPDSGLTVERLREIRDLLLELENG